MLKRATAPECQEWMKSRGISDLPPRTWSTINFRMPDSFSRRIYLAGAVMERLGKAGEILVWFQGWPFGTAAQLAILRCVGSASTTPVGLLDHPGYILPPPQKELAHGLFELACLYGMDALIADSEKALALMNHHEILTFAAEDSNKSASVSHEFLEAGLRPAE